MSPKNVVTEAFRDTLVVAELAQGPNTPVVPTSADIDVATLTKGDSEPVYLTLPIGKVGVTSGNQRHYDAEWIKELARQTLQRKPVGLMGHLAPDQRAWAFPDEAIHWIGVVHEESSGLLWGKGYLPPGPGRERIRRYQAQGKPIATSIACGPGTTGVWDSALNAYRMQANTMQLEQIDIAPADRAGIPSLAHIPVLTREMNEEEQEGQEEKSAMAEKIEVLKEMTVEDIPLIPKAVREAIVAEAPQATIVAEVQKTLGLEKAGEIHGVVSEMKRQQIASEKAAIAARIVEIATPDPKRAVADDRSIKVDSVRAVVIEMVKQANPQSVQEAESRYKEVAESALVADLLKTHVVTEMGPNQSVPLSAQGQSARYFPIPEDEKE